MKLALHQAKENGLEQMELGVYADNERAIHLYQKYGFEQCGIWKNAFKLKDGTYRDEILIVKFFKNLLLLLPSSQIQGYFPIGGLQQFRRFLCSDRQICLLEAVLFSLAVWHRRNNNHIQLYNQISRILFPKQSNVPCSQV